MSNTPQTQSSSQFLLGEISGKVDLVLVQMAANEARTQAELVAIKREQATLADDIASLKQGRSWLVGASAAIGAVVSTGLAVIGIGK